MQLCFKGFLGVLCIQNGFNANKNVIKSISTSRSHKNNVDLLLFVWTIFKKNNTKISKYWIRHNEMNTRYDTSLYEWTDIFFFFGCNKKHLSHFYNFFISFCWVTSHFIMFNRFWYFLRNSLSINYAYHYEWKCKAKMITLFFLDN